MKVITLAQQKGGVGKSTVAIHIAAEAERKKRRTVILELDRQGTASMWSDNRLYASDGRESDLMAGVDQQKLPPQVLKIEANQLERTLTTLNGLGVALVIIDLPGTHSTAVNAAIKNSDLVLIPARPHEVDIVASGETLGSVQRLRKPYAYILNLVDGSSGAKRAQETTDYLEAEGHPVCPSHLSRLVVFADAIADGRTVMEVKPTSKASLEVRTLWNWISKELEKDHGSRDEARSGQPAETHH